MPLASKRAAHRFKKVQRSTYLTKTFMRLDGLVFPVPHGALRVLATATCRINRTFKYDPSLFASTTRKSRRAGASFGLTQEHRVNIGKPVDDAIRAH